MGIQYSKLDNFQGTFTFYHTFPFLTAAFHFLNSAFHDLVLSCLSEQCHFYFSLLIHFHFYFPWPSIARYIRTMPPRSTSTTLSLGQSGLSDPISENLTQVTTQASSNSHKPEKWFQRLWTYMCKAQIYEGLTRLLWIRETIKKIAPTCRQSVFNPQWKRPQSMMNMSALPSSWRSDPWIHFSSHTFRPLPPHAQSAFHSYWIFFSCWHWVYCTLFLNIF